MRGFRKDAGFTSGRALARALNWQESKVSRIENGRQNASEATAVSGAGRPGTMPISLTWLPRSATSTRCGGSGAGRSRTGSRTGGSERTRVGSPVVCHHAVFLPQLPQN
nr:helix-turn-helix transcriptional regulator [Streptomyces sp. SID7805]